MAGDDAVQFGLGEPDFQPPELAVEAFARAMSWLRRSSRFACATAAAEHSRIRCRQQQQDTLDSAARHSFRSQAGVQTGSAGDGLCVCLPGARFPLR